MTTLLDRAFTEAAALPPEEQDALAAWILDELHADQRWRRALGESPAVLERLADEALADYRAGRTFPLPTGEA